MVKNDIFENIDYNELVYNVSTNGTSNLVKNPDYNTQINDIENKIKKIMIMLSISLLKNLMS